MADNKIVIAVAVVAVVVIAIAAAVFVMNNNNSSSDDGEQFYFYINYGDNNDKTGWYSAKATSTDDALAKAVKDKGITVTYGKYGYPNFDEGTWGVYSYLWDQCTSVTADASIKSPSYDTYESFVKSNGWESYSGYGNAEKKLNQSMSNVFYFAKYEQVEVGVYDIVDPTECELWAKATGSPFLKNENFAIDTDIYFYINFGDNNDKTGWYTAKGSNADVALEKALKDSGITLNYSDWGYPNFNGGTWGAFAYTWWQTNSTTASESVKAPTYGAWGDFVKSNGWDSFAGYDGNDAKKLHQSNANVFYFSMYDGMDIVDPTEDILWQTATGSPFAA